MKTFRKIGLAVVTALACLCATSCGDDNEDEPDGSGATGSGSGSVTATLGGSNWSLAYGYWYISTESTAPAGKKLMMLEFYNFDVTSGNVASLPSAMNFLSIGYYVPSSQNSVNSITVDAGEYDVYVVKDMPMNGSGYGWQAENFYGDRSGSPLVVTRDGDNVTVKIDNIAVGQESQSSAKTLKFKYSGRLQKMPEEYQD